MKLRNLLLILCLLFSTASQAQEFARVVPGRTFSFPRDHGSHPEFKTEWWYFTGHLSSEEGRSFGFQWTVFRIALLPPSEERSGSESEWRAREIYVGHLALSDLDRKKFYYAQSSFRGALDLAGSSTEDFGLRLPGWKGRSDAAKFVLSGESKEIALRLETDTKVPILLQGQEGYSPKSFETGKASYYYSMPHLPARGTLTLDGKTYSVQGQAWMDHEFGSDKLSKSQTGWDWFGLPLGGKSSLTLFRVRSEKGPEADYLAGTYVDAEGTIHPLSKDEIMLKPRSYWTSPATKATYPIEWQIELPRHALKLKVEAHFPEQELDTTATTGIVYWEGSVRVGGEAEGGAVDSKGYLEMTGYARRFEREI